MRGCTSPARAPPQPATLDGIPGSGRGKRSISEPSTTRFCPLTYDAADDARKVTAEAISSGRPTRPAGTRCGMPPSLGKFARCASVAMTPQDTTFILIPRAAHSTDTDFARFASPALAAPYAGAYGLLTLPEIEPTATIEPPVPWASKTFTAARTNRNT